MNSSRKKANPSSTKVRQMGILSIHAIRERGASIYLMFKFAQNSRKIRWRNSSFSEVTERGVWKSPFASLLSEPSRDRNNAQVMHLWILEVRVWTQSLQKSEHFKGGSHSTTNPCPQANAGTASFNLTPALHGAADVCIPCNSGPKVEISAFKQRPRLWWTSA